MAGRDTREDAGRDAGGSSEGRESGEVETGRDDPGAEGGRGRTADGDDGSEPMWYTGWRGPVFVSFYLLLTVVAVWISTAEFSFAAWLAGATRLVAGTAIEALGPIAGVSTPAAATPRWLVDRTAQPTLGTTIPFVVYLFGLAGALTRFLLSFVADFASLSPPGGAATGSDEPRDVAPGPPASGDEPAAEDDGDGGAAAGGTDDGEAAADRAAPEGSELELLRLVLGLPAAVYLAAGVYLVGTQVSGVFGRFDAQVLLVVVAYLVGFYVRRSYELLGDVADRLLEPVEGDEGGEERGSIFSRTFNLEGPGRSGGGPTTPGDRAEEEEEGDEAATPRTRPRYSGWRGAFLFGVTVWVAFAVLLAVLSDGPLSGVCGPVECGQVPLDVYLYSIMGGVGYVFTKLFVDVERSRRSVVESSVRILAGVFLAVGIYLLAGPVEGAVSAVAYLVGLYLNVAVVRFDALADQLFSRLSRAVRPGDRDERDGERDEDSTDGEGDGDGDDGEAEDAGDRDRSG